MSTAPQTLIDLRRFLADEYGVARKNFGIAGVISQIVLGATIIAQVSLKDPPPIGRADSPNGNVYFVRVRMMSPDPKLRDSVCGVLMAVLGSAFEVYGYKMRIGLASDVQPS